MWLQYNSEKWSKNIKLALPILVQALLRPQEIVDLETSTPPLSHQTDPRFRSDPFACTTVAWDKLAGDHYSVSILKWILRALKHICYRVEEAVLLRHQQRNTEQIPDYCREGMQSVAGTTSYPFSLSSQKHQMDVPEVTQTSALTFQTVDLSLGVRWGKKKEKENTSGYPCSASRAPFQLCCVTQCMHAITLNKVYWKYIGCLWYTSILFLSVRNFPF